MYRWTHEELEILKDKYVEYGPTKLSREYFPHIKVYTITAKAKSLGLTKCKAVWTPKELELLKAKAADCDINELLSILPGRSKEALRLKLNRLELDFKPAKRGGHLHKDRLTTIYLVRFAEYYKVGITQQKVARRMEGYPPYTIVWQVDNLCLEQAKIMESDILSEVELFKPEWDLAGKTECFKVLEPPAIPEVPEL